MKSKRYIAETLSSVLLVVYVLAMQWGYFSHGREVYVQSPDTSEQVLAVAQDNYSHTLPSEFSVAHQIKALKYPSGGNDNSIQAIEVVHVIQIKGLFLRQYFDALHALVDQKKVDLLYPFHFFG